jgi:hypothetical protein
MPTPPQPGDPDIDLDLHDVYLTAVIRSGHEFIVNADGGHGHWIDPDGTRQHITTITDLQFTFSTPNLPEPDLDTATNLLTTWWTTRTPLRVLSAPHRGTTLTAPDNTTLTTPRP